MITKPEKTENLVRGKQNYMCLAKPEKMKYKLIISGLQK